MLEYTSNGALTTSKRNLVYGQMIAIIKFLSAMDGNLTLTVSVGTATGPGFLPDEGRTGHSQPVEETPFLLVSGATKHLITKSSPRQ